MSIENKMNTDDVPSQVEKGLSDNTTADQVTDQRNVFVKFFAWTLTELKKGYDKNPDYKNTDPGDG